MKFAFVTQSYRADYKECGLLCKSIDRFAEGINHYIFVNDEDFELFQNLNYGRHKIYKKSSILPWYLIRIPWKMLGHKFYVSFWTYPVREWIVQQICKLGIFEIIGDNYDAVFHIDSECIFMRKFDISQWYVNGKYEMYKIPYGNGYTIEPSHEDYCKAIPKLLGIKDKYDEISRYNYMSNFVCFERENVKSLLSYISHNYGFGGWKRALCNQYRFSEFYTYGIYCDHILKSDNHFVITKRPFVQIERSYGFDKGEFETRMIKLLEENKDVMGVIIQKDSRKSKSAEYIGFEELSDIIYSYWKRN